MDSTTLMLSFAFGMVGMGYLAFGKKAGRMVPMAAGLGLMVVPCLPAGVLLTTTLCSGLVLAPWVIKDG